METVFYFLFVTYFFILDFFIIYCVINVRKILKKFKEENIDL